MFDATRPLGVPDEAFWADPWPNRHAVFDRCPPAPALFADGPAVVPAGREPLVAFVHSAPLREAALRPIRRTATVVAARLEDGLVRAAPAFEPPMLLQPIVDPGPGPSNLLGPVLDMTCHLLEDLGPRLQLERGRWVVRVLQHGLASNPVAMTLERDGPAPDPIGAASSPAAAASLEGPPPPEAIGVALGGAKAALLETVTLELEAGDDAPVQLTRAPDLPLRGAVRAPRSHAVVLQREAGELLVLPLTLVVGGTGEAAASLLPLVVQVEADGDAVVGSFVADLRQATGTLDVDYPRTLFVWAAARDLWAGPHRVTLVADADVGRAPPA